MMASVDIVTMSEDHHFFLPTERRPAFTSQKSNIVSKVPYIPYFQRDGNGVAKSFVPGTGKVLAIYIYFYINLFGTAFIGWVAHSCLAHGN